ncbi:MAG: hypothetical protein IH935_00780, partial [Acidobacteria bacterium]|nr:hypothetical protein [Acidobacteriota bacterium]
MKAKRIPVMFFSLCLFVGSVEAQQFVCEPLNQFSWERAHIVYIPHIAFGGGTEYLNALGEVGDPNDPDPLKRGFKLKEGWETGIIVSNFSDMHIQTRMMWWIDAVRTGLNVVSPGTLSLTGASSITSFRPRYASDETTFTDQISEVSSGF